MGVFCYSVQGACRAESFQPNFRLRECSPSLERYLSHTAINTFEVRYPLLFLLPVGISSRSVRHPLSTHQVALLPRFDPSTDAPTTHRPFTSPACSLSFLPPFRAREKCVVHLRSKHCALRASANRKHRDSHRAFTHTFRIVRELRAAFAKKKNGFSRGIAAKPLELIPRAKLYTAGRLSPARPA